RGAALEGLRWARWGSGDVDELLAIAEGIAGAAQEANDDALAVRSHVWSYLAHLDDGDLAAVRTSIDGLRARAASIPEPLALWYPPMAETTLALLSGQLENAGRSAFAALEVARRLELEWAVESFGIQYHQIRREQGRLAELEEATG